jgi:hypothetical protein
MKVSTYILREMKIELSLKLLHRRYLLQQRVWLEKGIQPEMRTVRQR